MPLASLLSSGSRPIGVGSHRRDGAISSSDAVSTRPEASPGDVVMPRCKWTRESPEPVFKRHLLLFVSENAKGARDFEAR